MRWNWRKKITTLNVGRKRGNNCITSCIFKMETSLYSIFLFVCFLIHVTNLSFISSFSQVIFQGSGLMIKQRTENVCNSFFFLMSQSWCNNSFYLLVNGTSVCVKSATICEDLVSCFKHHRRIWGHYYTFIWPEIFHLLFRIITFANHSLSLKKLLILYGLIKYK